MNNQNKITDFFGTHPKDPKDPKDTPTFLPPKPVLPLHPVLPDLPDLPVIPGLTVIQDYITREDETALLNAANASEWSNSLKRRVQHYGYAYDYQQRTTSVEPIRALPDWTHPLMCRLHNDGFFTELPTQLIVNEYLPGQGIGAHTDANTFGPTVATISLDSSCGFVFTRKNTQLELFLKPRTLVVMTGKTRYLWKHSILQRKQDIAPNGNTIKRGTRVSLTFRTMAT